MSKVCMVTVLSGQHDDLKTVTESLDATPPLHDSLVCMTSDPKENQLQSLINGALNPATAGGDAQSAALDTPEEQASTLIDIYFELDEPIERDALLDQLMKIKTDEVSRFLEEMAHQDEDPFLRSCAAAELCKRGQLSFVSILEADFKDPNNAELFAQAASALVALRGAELFPALEAAWKSTERDPAQREEALLAMEQVDAQKTLALVTTWLTNVDSPDSLDDELIEQAALLFARHQYSEAKRVFSHLQTIAARLDTQARTDFEGLLEEAQSLIE